MSELESGVIQMMRIRLLVATVLGTSAAIVSTTNAFAVNSLVKSNVHSLVNSL